MSLTQVASQLYDSILALAYPQACLICAGSVESRELTPVCLDCWNATRIFDDTVTVCWKCGVPMRQTAQAIESQQIRCRQCDVQLFDVARACGIYEGALRESALLLKRQPHLSKHLISLLVAAAQRPPLNSSTRIVPVPLHPDREHSRGFNQAVVIADSIGPALGLMVNCDSLVRSTAADRYRAGLDAKGRAETVANSFAVRFPSVVSGEIILLIDDVFTTGATASSCASALLGAGATAVYVLTIARPAR